ncbi:MAG: carboxypeptidase regulatory-like domain-containing protein [Patescibacteria group bacterium]|nr:carboxypeptidase regulatory-like domain-containing protein [Patescibacteria group bacterium]
MRKTVLLLVTLLPIPVFGQISYSTISGTVTDANSNPLANATIVATLVNVAGIPVSGPVTPNGQLYNGSPVYGTLDATGHFSLNLVPNGILSRPSNTQWRIQISAPQDPAILTFSGSWNVRYQFTVTGNQDIGATLSSLVTQNIAFLNTKTGQSTFAQVGGNSIANQLNNTVPLATGPNAIRSQSHINENTPGITQITQQLQIADSTHPSQVILTPNGNLPSSVAGSGVLAVDPFGYLESVGTGFITPFVQSVSCNGQRLTGTGSDQAAVQAAINFIATNAPNGRGTLRFPEGQNCYIYMPTGSPATEALLMTTPVSISGSAQFYFDIPSTMDRIRIAPNAATGYWPNPEDLFFNMVWRDVTITGATAVGTPAATSRNGVVFDCTNNALGKILFDNVYINSVVAGGFSLYMDNTTNANGCIYDSTFVHSHFASGVSLTGAGDTNVFRDDKITNQYGDGIFLNSANGGRQNRIESSNIITGGCPIHVTQAFGLIIDGVEIGIQNYGSNTCPADIWLEPTSPGNIDGVMIENSSLGTDENNTLAVHNLQIDSGVQNVQIYSSNQWNPQSVSGVPTSAVLNNGSFTCLEKHQKPIITSNNLFWSGSGSTCQNNFAATQGLGNEQENRLSYSEDGTHSPWQPLTSGGGTATISTVSGVVLPDGTTGSATRLQLAATTGQSASIYQAIPGLPNPHASTEQVYIRNTTCPSSTVYNLAMGGAANNQEIISDCNGDMNGWRKGEVGLPAAVALATDYFFLGLNGVAPYSTTADVLITRMQQSADLVPYIKTTANPVPLSYGSNETAPVSTPRSTFGYQMTATGAPPVCSADNAGTVVNYPGSGPYPALANQVIECDLINSSPAVYAWQTVFKKPQQPENYLLQSNNWNSTPTWVFEGNSPALAPVVTAAPSVTDPFGNTGTVQEVYFNLNGDNTLNHLSAMQQTVTAPSGATTGTASIWVQAKTGTPLFFINGSGACGHSYTAPAAPAWLQVSLACAGATQFQMGLAAGLSYPNTADIYIFSGCTTFHGGSCTDPVAGRPTTTTTTVIDSTAYTSLDPGFTLRGQAITGLAPASLTTTAATSDNVTVTGMTSSGHCAIAPTNAAAATNIATTYVSAKTTNQITVAHAATSNMTYDMLCTAN